MTKTLTEQWREGKLPEGWYYTIIKGFTDKEKMMIDYFIPELNHFEIKPTRCIKEVLAPVPSYDEYKRLQEQLKDAEKTKYDLELIIKRLKRRSICEKQKAKARKEHINELIAHVADQKEEIARRGRMINELKTQRKEANELIKIATPLFSFGSEKADAEFSDFKRYLIRWGVK